MYGAPYGLLAFGEEEPSGGTSPVTATVARPNADVSTGGWVSTRASLWDAIDELIVDDTDYISTSTASTCEISLSETAYPGTASQAVIYRASSINGSTLTVTLKQGATTIATWSHGLTPTLTTYRQELTSGQIAALTSGLVSVTLAAS